jgi:hypothetical protein
MYCNREERKQKGRERNVKKDPVQFNNNLVAKLCSVPRASVRTATEVRQDREVGFSEKKLEGLKKKYRN